jgi:hypothetical protein
MTLRAGLVEAGGRTGAEHDPPHSSETGTGARSSAAALPAANSTSTTTSPVAFTSTSPTRPP